jgi:hypothetical protein
MKDVRRLLAIRAYRVLLLARSASLLGNVMTPIALAFAVLDSEGIGGASRLAFVNAGGEVVQSAHNHFGGVIADRLPRGWLMSRTELFSGACQVGIAAMVWQEAIVWPLLGLLFALKGAGNALFLPASAGVVPSIVPADDLVAANATLRLSMNVVRIGGAGAATLIALSIGPHGVLWVDAATYLVSGVALATVAWPVVAPRPARTSFVSDLASGWREFSSRRWVLVPVLQMTVINAAVSAFMSVLGPAVSKESGWGLPGWSALVTAHTVGLVVGSVLAMRVGLRRPMLWAVCLAGAEAMPLLLLGFGGPLVVVLVAMFVTALVMDVYSVVWDSTIQRGVPEDALSRISSYDMLASFSGAPLGVALVGVLLGHFAPATVLLWCGGVVLVTTPLALLSSSVRGFRLVPEQRPAVVEDPSPTT